MVGVGKVDGAVGVVGTYIVREINVIRVPEVYAIISVRAVVIADRDVR